MAFLLVVWSIKNVVCGIVCLLALAWTAPKFGPEDSNALQEQLDQIHENLGRHDVSHSLESIQAWMAPSFEALPKYSASSGIGSSAKPRLQTLAAKHLLHSYFNLHHGLNIEGLQSYNSQREPNRQALADSALVKRSNKLRAALQESPQGYSLSELASIALLLQRLVMKEIRITFKVAWRLRNHSASAELTWEELHEVFCAALAVAHDWDQVIINLESLKRGAPAVFHERFRIGQEFATGHVKSWRNIRKFVTKLSRKSLRPAPFYSFKTALPTYLALYMGYGNYQNFDCRDMKTQLSRLDSTGSGRLPLKAYSKEEQDTDISKIAYLQDVPRTIIEKDTLEKLLKVTPRDQWEDPPEDTYLYTLKTFAEVYGPGKATKMGWWDYFRLKVDLPDTAELQDEEDAEYVSEYYRLMMEGKVPFAVPGPAGYWYTGAIIQWKGKEPFAGDQVQTLLENGRWSKQFLSNLAFYREGLKPWQRGLEIGMAHGYFLIGPFTSLGPLRNTPEAATVGLLCGCAIVGIVSVGGLIFGSTIKPTRFDKPGDKPAAGFIEMINWHAIGGLGGAGFAHALITIFGS